MLIKKESPLGADLALLMARHTADMRAETPPESCHMMDAGQLDRSDIQFFVMRDAGQPVAMGAIKHLDPTHAEVKSMHVLAEWRGRGLSKQMLLHLIDAAKTAGISRLSLETGAQPMFGAARALYLKAGFAPCPPFGDYVEDPNSVFMTRDSAS